MTRTICTISAFLALGTVSVQAQTPNSASHPAATAAQSWWRAFAHGDTAYVRKHSSPDVQFTMSVGRQLSGTEVLDQAAGHKTATVIPLAWSDIAVQTPSAGVAIVTQQVAEGTGRGLMTFRYLAVLERRSGEWRFHAGHSTRVSMLTARIDPASAPSHADFIGTYDTPRGAVLRVIERAGTLRLIEPSGAETILDPIGPGLFEVPQVSATGVVRFLFARGPEGAVVSLSRISHDVLTFPRSRTTR